MRSLTYRNTDLAEGVLSEEQSLVQSESAHRDILLVE